MKCQFDSLQYVKILGKKGVDSTQAEAIIELLTEVDIRNLYSKAEIDTMLPQTVQTMFDKFDRQFEQRRQEAEQRAEQRRQEAEQRLNEQRKEFNKRLEEDRKEAIAGRRWQVATIITCSFALAGYLSIIIHIAH